MNEIVIYKTADSQTQIEVQLDNNTVWLTQDLMAKPGVTAAQSFRTIPFTTIVNNPNVRMLIGNVRNNKTGRTNMFAAPMTIAVSKALKKPLI